MAERATQAVYTCPKIQLMPRIEDRASLLKSNSRLLSLPSRNSSMSTDRVAGTRPRTGQGIEVTGGRASLGGDLHTGSRGQLPVRSDQLAKACA